MALTYPNPRLEDGVVLLRPWEEQDLALLERGSRDDYVAEIEHLPVPFDDEGGRKWIARQHAHMENGRGWTFAILELATGEAVGGVGLLFRHPPGAAEPGVWVVAEKGGHGIAERATRLLCRWALTTETGIARLQATVAPWNLPSQRVLEKVGFVREGLLRAYASWRGSPQDVLLYSLLARDLDDASPLVAEAQPASADPAGAAQISRLQERLATAFISALRERLVALVAYGSSVEGSFIPHFSDFDLAVFLHGEFTVEDAIAVQAALGDLEPTPFDYLQTKFVDVSAVATPTLVPGSFAVFWGELPAEPAYLHNPDLLRQAGKRWLDALPGLIADDRAAWSVAAGSARRQRLVRLMMTRLKPALRSLLVEHGEPPAEVWISGWHQLARRWRDHDAAAAEALDSVLTVLPSSGREQEVACGETVLRLLAQIEMAARASSSTN